MSMSIARGARGSTAGNKLFPKPGEGLGAPGIQFAVATHVIFVFYVNICRVYGLPLAPLHLMGCGRFPTIRRLMEDLENPEDPLVYAVVVRSVMQGCLNAFSPVVTQSQGFSCTGAYSGDGCVWPKSSLYMYFVNTDSFQGFFCLQYWCSEIHSLGLRLILDQFSFKCSVT